MREDFLSLNDIKKRNVGFQFYTKDGSILYELLSVKKEMIPVAYGFLGDMYQEKTTITVMNKDGKVLSEGNLTNKTNGGNIYNIAYIEKNWDELNFKTVESIVREKKSEYREYLESFVKDGKMTELEMYKVLNENSFNGVKFQSV